MTSKLLPTQNVKELTDTIMSNCEEYTNPVIALVNIYNDTKHFREVHSLSNTKTK